MSVGSHKLRWSYLTLQQKSNRLPVWCYFDWILDFHCAERCITSEACFHKCVKRSIFIHNLLCQYWKILHWIIVLVEVKYPSSIIHCWKIPKILLRYSTYSIKTKSDKIQEVWSPFLSFLRNCELGEAWVGKFIFVGFIFCLIYLITERHIYIYTHTQRKRIKKV